MRVVTLDSWRKARAGGAWGSSKNRFLDWTVGETVVVLVARDGVVTGDVSGPRLKSDLTARDNDAYQWPVPLAEMTVVEGMAAQRLNAGVRTVLRCSYGEQVYFRVLLHGMKLGDEPEARIRELLQSPASAEQPCLSLKSAWIAKQTRCFSPEEDSGGSTESSNCDKTKPAGSAVIDKLPALRANAQ
ncbi:MAG: hypothetical protein NTZ77_03775 [Caldiserica bacterium]|nr:hypothetical protein [Caldisericota bacterium]